MKKSWIKKAIATITTIALSASMAIPVFAAELPESATNETNEVREVVDIDPDGTFGISDGISTYAYHDWTKFSFRNRYTGPTRWYDGGHMAVEICATSDTPGLTMQVTAHIIGDRAVTRNVPVDGNTYKWDWLSLGTSQGRNVYLEYSCDQNTSAVINVLNKSYSW